MGYRAGFFIRNSCFVISCHRKYEVDKVCRSIPPTTVPVTTPVTSPSTTATTKQVSSQKTEITLPSKSTTSAFFPTEPKSDNEPEASQKGKLTGA